MLSPDPNGLLSFFNATHVYPATPAGDATNAAKRNQQASWGVRALVREGIILGGSAEIGESGAVAAPGQSRLHRTAP